MQNYLDLRNITDYTKIQEPAKIIKENGIVVFPTETVYGIGVNAFDENAVKKLYDIKKRPVTQPTSLLVSNLEMINQVARDITELEYALIKEFFPGPLTIILKKKSNISNIVTANGNTIGVRMPSEKIALTLIEYAGVPIATSSANIADKSVKEDVKDIMQDFNETVDYYIDGGKSKIGLASTIIKVIDNVPHILRQGPISEEQIKTVCEKYNHQNTKNTTN